MYKVLIIEDDANTRALLQTFIAKRFGFTVKKASNGIEGLSLLQEFIPDFILLDISMPFMSGIQVLEAIRNESKYRNIPIIIMSAHNDKNSIDQTIKLGITDYILKPIDLKLTYERIQKVVNESRKPN